MAGAAIDVYEKEPPEDRALIEHDKVLCTPHLGASTEEAQIKVAVDAAAQLLDALAGREVRFAVNAPMMDWSKMPGVAPLATLAYRMGELLSQLTRPGARIRKIELVFAGDIPADAECVVTAHLLVAVLRRLSPDPVNLVNVRVLAKESRIDFQTTRSTDTADFTELLSARVVCDNEEKHATSGAIFQRDEPRIVALDGFAVEAIPTGDLLVIFENDRPGLVGEIGTVLGSHGINIARMTFGRKAEGGDAIVVLNVDSAPEADFDSATAEIGKAHEVRLVRLSGAPSAWVARE